MAALCWSSREEIPHAQGKRNPTKTVGVARRHQRANTLKPYSQKTSQSNHTRTTALSNSMELSYACGATQDGWVMVERCDRMWSTGEGNGKSLQYSCLENPMNSMKRSGVQALQSAGAGWVCHSWDWVALGRSRLTESSGCHQSSQRSISLWLESRAQHLKAGVL